MERLNAGIPRLHLRAGHINKVFSVLLVLLPFLYQYRGIGSIISFGECILIPFMLWFVYKDGVLSYIPSGKELLFYVAMFAGTCTALLAPHFVFTEALSILLRLAFYAVLMTAAKKHFNKKTGITVYYWVVLAFSVYLLLQVAVEKIWGSYLPIYLNYNWLFPPEQRAPDLAVHYQWGFRASSLFLEPGYFVLFCIPFLCLYPFGKKSWKQYIPFAVVALAAFMSGAAASIGVLGIVFTVLFFDILKRLGMSVKHAILIFAGLVLIAGIVFMTADFASGALARLQSGGSFNQRITRGFLIFDQLPFFRKLFGVGLNNIGSYVVFHDIVTPFDESDRGYMCSMLSVLNSGGLIGFGCFVAYLYSIGKKVWRYKAGLCLFLSILFLCSYESVLFSYRFAFCFVLLIPIMRHKEKREAKAALARKSKRTGPVKVLLVDNRSDGHHQSYVDGLILCQETRMITCYPRENPAAYKSYICQDADRGMNLLQYLKLLKEINHIARRERVEAIHLLCVDTFYRYFGLGLGYLRRKASVVVTAHHIRRSILRDIAVKMIARQVDTFVVHTESLQEELGHMGITNVAHVEYPQFNAVPQMEQSVCKNALGLPDDGVPVLLALGGTRQDKGLDILLEALQQVESDFHLLIAGSEEDITKEQIEQLCEGYGEHVTTMLQYLTDEQFAMCLNACDKVVLPYRRCFNGASGPLGEGVRFGKQIIGPEHGSIGGIITKNHLGSTFVTEDPADLAAVIDTALQRQFVCDDVYAAYQQGLDPKFFTQKYMGIYRKLCRI